MLSQTLHSNFHENCFEIVVSKNEFSPAQACHRATCFPLPKTKTLSTSLLSKKPAVMETSSCFHVFNFGQKRPKTKVLLQKLILGCTLLFWFEIKPSLMISIQLHLKRFATSMMSFYMTSPALFIQMPSDGLWSVKQTNSTSDYVILYEKVSSVRLR